MRSKTYTKISKQVVGFLFTDSSGQVVLIQKNSPAWEAGCYNAPGGKVEQGETPAMAMRREYFEETGVDIPDWKFLRMEQRGDVELYLFFYQSSDCVHRVTTITDEFVEPIRVRDILFNLIPMVCDVKSLVFELFGMLRNPSIV